METDHGDGKQCPASVCSTPYICPNGFAALHLPFCTLANLGQLSLHEPGSVKLTLEISNDRGCTHLELNLVDVEVPEGQALSVFPPATEHYSDPFWWDAGGRDQLVQARIFHMNAGPERTGRLGELIAQFPRYGPKMYESAAEGTRPDIIRDLFALGADPSIEEAKRLRDGESEDDVPTAPHGLAPARRGSGWPS